MQGPGNYYDPGAYSGNQNVNIDPTLHHYTSNNSTSNNNNNNSNNQHHPFSPVQSFVFGTNTHNSSSAPTFFQPDHPHLPSHPYHHPHPSLPFNLHHPPSSYPPLPQPHPHDQPFPPPSVHSPVAPSHIPPSATPPAHSSHPSVRIRIPPRNMDTSPPPRRSTRLNSVPVQPSPPPALSSRRSERHQQQPASGSEYNESDADAEGEEEEDIDLAAAASAQDHIKEEEEVHYTKSKRGRTVKQVVYVESDDMGDEQLDLQDDDDEMPVRRPQRTKSRNLKGFVEEDEEENDDDDDGGVPGYATRSKDKKRLRTGRQQQQLQLNGSRSSRRKSDRAKRAARRNKRAEEEDAAYEDDDGQSSDDGLDDAPETSDHDHLKEDGDRGKDDHDDLHEVEAEAGTDTGHNGRRFRPRTKIIDYNVVHLLDQSDNFINQQIKSKGSKKNDDHSPRKRAVVNVPAGVWVSAEDGYDSEDELTLKQLNAGRPDTVGGLPSSSGGPHDYGRVGDAMLADADPLGVNVNVTFDEVGGLDEHIHSLKEMTLLPLLYPEVFQQFGVTPPRGVLFHGPPGTGKTLLARALAASCRTDGRKVSFFMRKGADCLSKWVGEAERQLRLLFEEARASQPSIIFFDEIDGLAPVRSSKQDQIHASIVSTLLALMDGMDGRGQVVVIGATNRPDAVDPALRRPGRFDREFYFGLPSLEAREKILGIMTRGWKGWGMKEQGVADNVKGLAKLTKGYGGADLRALCTEAALNAIQRRYPQIYKSQDRLLLSPETIEVELRDFMISVKKIVPSSARSSSSVANPLPTQLVPLLSSTLDQAKSIVSRIMPVDKHRTALEEAEYEDAAVGGEQGLAREMLMQSMESLRIYRPRIAICGEPGMGQTYVGAAVLHHLEGYHVQSLELGSLMSDSTRSVETAIVQLFVEAKRHRPSVVFIPSLVGWCAAVTETARSTVRAMLDSLSPTDPILLLAIVDGEFRDLPRDVRAWFGPTAKNRVQMIPPGSEERELFFSDLIKDVCRPPNEFPDGMPRRKRVLEDLPLAPPIPPKKPNKAELLAFQRKDKDTLNKLKLHWIEVLKKYRVKYRKLQKSPREDFRIETIDDEQPPPNDPPAPISAPQPTEALVIDSQMIDIDGTQPLVEGGGQLAMSTAPAMEGVSNEMETLGDSVPSQAPPIDLHGAVADATAATANTDIQHIIQPSSATSPLPPPPAAATSVKLYDIYLDKIEQFVHKPKYLTPDEILLDFKRLLHTATVLKDHDRERYNKADELFTEAQVEVFNMDPTFTLECRRMAVRERLRREEAKVERKVKEKEAKEREEKERPDAHLDPPLRRSGRVEGKQPEYLELPPSGRGSKRHRSTEGGGDSQTHSEEETRGKKMRLTPPHTGSGIDEDELNIGSTPRSAVKIMNSISTPGLQVDGPAQTMDVDALPATSGASQPQPHLTSLPFPHAPASLAPLLNGTHTPTPSTPRSGIQNLLNPIGSDLTMSSRRPTPVPESQVTEPDTQPPSTSTPPSMERTPTPPLPSFYVDETKLQELKLELRDNTFMLNVEQLEQLRATCLGCVWHRRKEWNRTGLIEEILGVRQDFVTEVELDMADSRVNSP